MPRSESLRWRTIFCPERSARPACGAQSDDRARPRSDGRATGEGLEYQPEFGLLPTAPCVARRLGVDAAHGRTASGTPLRGLAHAARFSGARRRRRRPPTCGDADEAHGDRGDLSASQPLETRAGPQDLPVSAARREGRAANQVWATDITYIPMARGFVYLVAVVDWFTRRVLPIVCRSRWRPAFAWRRWRRLSANRASRRFSTPTRAANSPARRSPASCSRTASPSVWTARAPGATTFSWSGSGNR